VIVFFTFLNRFNVASPPSTTATTVIVDVISDVICPWCYIGKRRLEKAIAALDGQHEVPVHWHFFYFQPIESNDAKRRDQSAGISHQKIW